MTIRALLGLVGLLLAVAPVQAAEPITGATLAAQCPAALDRLAGKATSPQAAQAASFCLGYLSGIVHAYAVAPAAGMTPLYCVPEGADIGHMMRVVLSYLREHPEQHDVAGITVVTQALEAAYPCHRAP
jgi:hypothetical protein